MDRAVTEPAAASPDTFIKPETLPDFISLGCNFLQQCRVRNQRMLREEGAGGRGEKKQPPCSELDGDASSSSPGMSRWRGLPRVGGEGKTAIREGNETSASLLTPAGLRVPQRLHGAGGLQLSSGRGSPPPSIAPVPPSPPAADAAAAGGAEGEHPPIAMDTGVPTGGSAGMEPEQLCRCCHLGGWGLLPCPLPSPPATGR